MIIGDIGVIMPVSVITILSVIAANIASFGNLHNTLLCTICIYRNYCYLCKGTERAFSVGTVRCKLQDGCLSDKHGPRSGAILYASRTGKLRSRFPLALRAVG